MNNYKKMKVIKAKFGDFEAVRQVALEWKANCNNKLMGIEIVDDIYMADIARLINEFDKDLLLLVTDNNEIVGYMGMTFFNSLLGRQKIANEHYWYVAKNYRGRDSLLLIEAARQWAKEKGCSHLQMNASNLASDLHDKICKFYEHIGMKKFETSYIEEIK